MEYEEKYKNALERAREYKKYNYMMINVALDNIFPELKESKDERIRNALIAFHKATIEIDGIKGYDIIEWLEKQGKACNSIIWHNISEEPNEQEELLCECESEDATWHDIAFYHADTKTFWNGKKQIVNVIKWIYIHEFHEKQGKQKETLCDKCKKAHPSHFCQDITALGRCALEKQGEQKSVDKVEKKFHEGDFIIANDSSHIYQVMDVKRGIYIIKDLKDDVEYHIGIEEAHKSGRLWTIQYAKDGDVYVAKGSVYIAGGSYLKDYLFMFSSFTEDNVISTHFGYDVFHGTFDTKLTRFGREEDFFSVTPATKEQRTLLFQKMHEAGYEWDSEKKELKKAETKGGGNESK